VNAALELLAANGFRGLTIEAVAGRSGVARTTIYRWWPSKEALLLEALFTLRQQAPVPDTGTIRDDAVAHLQGHIKAFNDSRTAPILADALAEALRSPDLGHALRGGLAVQREPFRHVLERAVEGGELPADLDHELAIDLLIGPIVNRALVSGGPLEPALAERVVDVVLEGLRATAARALLPPVSHVPAEGARERQP
jgi:AcrR family transcriptional regulator